MAIIPEFKTPNFDKKAFKSQLMLTKSSEALHIGQDSINEEENEENTKFDDLDYDD